MSHYWMATKKNILNRDTQIEKYYLDGFTYHQNEAKKDKKLMEWIKRDSYIKNGNIK